MSKLLYESDSIVLQDDGTQFDQYEFSDPNDGSLIYADEKDAEALALAILDNLGKTGAVRASDVSFNEGLIRLAAVHGKTVTFRYAKGDGAVIEQRTLKPESVKEVGGHVTFVGYDPDRDGPRAYRVDRMKGEVSVA